MHKAASEWQWGDQQPSPYVFTDELGYVVHPDDVLEQVQALVRETGLPSIRLHDPRRGAEIVARTAGVDLKTVSEMLGHSSTTITADIYSSVVNESKRAAADAIADLLADEDDE